MARLNRDQEAVVTHLNSEHVRFKRMGQRLRTLHMPILATCCETVAQMLKDNLDLQIRILTRGDTIKPTNW